MKAHILNLLLLVISQQMLNAQEYYSGKGSSPTGTNHEQIDTLWIFPPKFRITKTDDYGIRDYLPEMSHLAQDSMILAMKDYFADTSVADKELLTSRSTKNIKIQVFDSLKTKEIGDSIMYFYYKLLKNPVTRKHPDYHVPSYFFEIMDSCKMDYALITYADGFVKDDYQYKREVAGKVILYILEAGISGGIPTTNIDAVQYESHVDCFILDRKNRTVIFRGISFYPLPPCSQQTLHFQLHTMFDEFLSKKKK